MALSIMDDSREFVANMAAGRGPCQRSSHPKVGSKVVDFKLRRQSESTEEFEEKFLRVLGSDFGAGER